MLYNGLVDLVNMVDGNYRTELRAQNEANFARFDAKLEQRLAELRGDLRSEIASQGASLRKEILDQGSAIAALDTKFTERLASFEVLVHREITTHTRWMVGLWAAQMTAFLIIAFAVLQKGP